MNELVVEDRRYAVVQLPGRPPALLDRDVAKLYETETPRVNEARSRNPEKFPEDFCFQISDAELDALKSQFAISNPREFNRGNPWAYTWEGCNMLATILKSDVATKRAIQIVRGFTRLEQALQQRKTIQEVQEIDEDPLVVMARNHVALQREQDRQRNEQLKQAVELAEHRVRLEEQRTRIEEQRLRLEEERAARERQQLQLEKQEQRLDAEKQLREESLEELHVKADTILEDMYQWRVTTYARKNDIRLNLEEAKRLGKEASRLSRESGRRIGRIFDPICQRNVNTYDPDILDLVFQRWQERNAEFN